MQNKLFFRILLNVMGLGLLLAILLCILEVIQISFDPMLLVFAALACFVTSLIFCVERE